MAIRVTEQEVLDIMDSGIEISSTQMIAMITAASSVIDNVFADDANVTDALLKELERWLSAHYVASTLARMAEKEKVGQAEVTYMGKWGEMLKSTPYGQVLLTLDTTGKLAKVGKRAVSIYAIPSFED